MSTAAATDNNSTGKQSSHISSIGTNDTAVYGHHHLYQQQITASSPHASINKYPMNTFLEITKKSLPTLPSSWMDKVQRGFVYVGVFMAMFSIIVQSAIVAPAMSKIATDMHDIGNQTWVAVAYFLGLNCAQAIAGKVSTKTACFAISREN